MKLRIFLLVMLAAVTAYAGGQIGVTGYPAVPRTLKGGTGINIKPDGTFEATGEAVSIGAQPFENLSTALRGKFLPISGTAADANAYKGASSPSATEFNYLQGVTSDIQTQLNGKIGSIRFSSYSSNRQAEYSTQQSTIAGKLDSATAATTYKSQSAFNSFSTATQGKVDTVYNTLQPNIDAKQSTVTGAATTITSTNLTASRAVVSNSSGKVAVSTVTSAELGYLSGVTSSVQTQLNGKLSTSTAFNGDVSGTASNLQVLDDSHAHTSATLPLNNSTQAGIVATGAGQVNKVWKTDSSGIPQWRDDATGGSPSFDTLTGGTNTASTFVIGTGSSLTYTGTGAVDASRYKGEFAPTAEEFSYLSGVTSGIQEQINGLDDATQTALDGKASTSHASTHATGNSDALTPGDIGAFPANGQPSYAYTSAEWWAGIANYDQPPSIAQFYAGSTAAASTSENTLVRGQNTIAVSSNPTFRGASYSFLTTLRPSHSKKWTNFTLETTDFATGKYDHGVLSVYAHAGANRTDSAGSSGGDLWGIHIFGNNNGYRANGIAMEINQGNKNTTANYFDDNPSGPGPNSYGNMQTHLQIGPDGGLAHSTRGISLINLGSLACDTGITLTGYSNVGMHIGSPDTVAYRDYPTNAVPATKTDIKWLAGTSVTGLNLSARTFTGDAISLGANHTIGDGTLHRKLSDLAPLASPSFTTPTLGVATATSVNGLTITSSTGTLTVANGATLTGNQDVSTTATPQFAKIGIGRAPTSDLIAVAGSVTSSGVTVVGSNEIVGNSLAVGMTDNTRCVVSGFPFACCSGSGTGTCTGPTTPAVKLHIAAGAAGTPNEMVRIEAIGNAGATRGPRQTFYGPNAGSSQVVAAIDGLSPSAGNGALEISTNDSATLTKHVRVDSTGVAVTGAMAATGAISGASLSVTGNAAAKTFAATIPAAATDGATVTFDLAAGDSPSVTLGGNRTLAFSNPVVGSWYTLTLKQGASGGPYTVTWPSTGLVCTFIKSDGTTTTTGPTLHTAASSRDTIVIHPTSTTAAECYAAGY